MVSIIIPAYNVEKYIFRGIESCIAQTYKDIEVIVINDGSTDCTFKIISDYAEIDHRIRVYNQQNKGVSVARNKGIEEARGDYIIFLDADDWLENTTVEEMVQNYKCRYLLSFDYKLIYLQNNSSLNEILPNAMAKDTLIERNSLIKSFCCSEYNLISSCYKLFDRKILIENNILFEPKIHNGEDGLFVFRYLLCVDGLIYKNKPYWNILKRPGSATNSGYNKRMATAIDAATMIVSYIDHDPVNARYGKYYFTNRAFSVKKSAACSGARLSAEEKEKINTAVKRYAKNYIQVEKSVPKKLKLLMYNSPFCVVHGLLTIYYRIFCCREKNMW